MKKLVAGIYLVGMVVVPFLPAFSGHPVGILIMEVVLLSSIRAELR